MDSWEARDMIPRERKKQNYLQYVSEQDFMEVSAILMFPLVYWEYMLHRPKWDMRPMALHSSVSMHSCWHALRLILSLLAVSR